MQEGVLSPRKRQVLRAVVTDYIDSGEPVGSRTIARKYNLGSPATVRNEMADLEESGYLEQPHTSAGRVPSDLGYRTYVDQLMDPPAVTSEEAARVHQAMAGRARELAALVRQSTRILAYLTNYTALALLPTPEQRVYRQVQVVSVDLHHVLLLLVSEPGIVDSRLVFLEQAILPDELEKISVAVSSRLRGVKAGQISYTLCRELAGLVPSGELYEALMDLLNPTEGGNGGAAVVEGATHLLRNFSDRQQALDLMGLLDAQNRVQSLLEGALTGSGVRVQIGQENPLSWLRQCSVVLATYFTGQQAVGTIGVLGPTRLDYHRSMALVGLVADTISEMLSHWNRTSF